VAPSAVVGEPARLRLAPRAPIATPVDVHVLRIPPGQPRVQFLSAAGRWTAQPSPWQRAVRLEGALETSWREDVPRGWATLLVVFTTPGGHPLDRGAWTHAPLLTRVALRASGAPAPGTFPPWALPAAATVAATALVLAYGPGRRRPVSG
jgi:hypothetical protein